MPIGSVTNANHVSLTGGCKMRRIEVLAVEDASSDLFHLTNVLDDMGVEHSLSVADDGERAVLSLETGHVC
jgi:hypothetical protein